MVSADPYVSPMDSVSPAVEEAFVKTDQKPSPVKGMLRRGFFGLRTVAPSLLKVKKASSLTLAAREDFSSSSQKMGPLRAESQASFTVSTTAHPGFSSGSSSRAAKLGTRIHLSHPEMTKSGAPIYSSVSKSQ
jgi:hypothetical protein